ncbi:carboxypeptidase-like regulatory domain-containing protein [Rhodocytophaga rosea]|uniref:Carboxypeptidase-like regulatory domain-containing protein n=1 Tax=Rhodocytophaga rosea TaxID=2704465 RepID=A0A6C0GKX2_9BACT|nr:carboxypeptidase-like regulatory domain-containing protein [Rhodocytophaga rosea]QHT68658.1 carboxypeptidase-like regulatory domain-containing protein [Rhodocytophaga rosea]
MKFSIQLVLLFFGIGAFLPLLAQQSAESKLLSLSGTVLSADSLKPVTGVHVLNIKSRTGATTDDKGYFSIAMHRTDTILFSAVGYEVYHFVLDPASKSNSPLVQIKLTPKIYELKEVDVRAIPTEDQFKKDFLGLKLPDEPELQLPQIKQPKLTEGVEYMPSGGVAVVGPFSAIYNKVSREAKEKKKVQALRVQEYKKKSYETKFNQQLVQRLTGLKDQALEEFMKYCKLSEAMVIQAENEYEIVIAINNCFKEFKESKGMN